MMRNKPDLIADLQNAYNLFNEVLESQPSKSYIALMNKLKIGGGKPPINLKLLDKKDYIDSRIKSLTEEILSIIGFE
jgi:hypothetical protein